MRGLLGIATRIYFREVAVQGEPAPDTAGRLFAANHWNGIVDPLVILTSARYRASPIAKSTLFSVPIFSGLLRLAGAVPVMRKQDQPPSAGVDNDAIFDRVASHLGAGGNVLIFPEGISHDEPQVQPLKTGAARMLARARSSGAGSLTLQAVALDFDARDTFRSRALVTYGPVHHVDEVAASVPPDELVHALTERIAADLDRLVLQGESQGELLVLRQLAELLANDGGDGSHAEEAEIARTAVVAARNLGAGDPRYRRVEQAVSAYTRERALSGVTDRQVARGGAALGLRRLLHGAWMTILAPLAVLGALLYLVPYKLPRLGTALAKGETDVVSTYKLGIGLIAFPLWATLLLVGAALLPLPAWGRLVAAGLVLASPFAALPWLDRLDDHRGQRLLLQATAPDRLTRLRELRRLALDAIAAAR